MLLSEILRQCNLAPCVNRYVSHRSSRLYLRLLLVGGAHDEEMVLQGAGCKFSLHGPMVCSRPTHVAELLSNLLALQGKKRGSRIGLLCTAGQKLYALQCGSCHPYRQRRAEALRLSRRLAHALAPPHRRHISLRTLPSVNR